MTHFEFHPEYVAYLSVDTREAIIGHIHHVQRSGELTREVPVAYFHATMAVGGEWSVEHHNVLLFIRSSVRYDPRTHSTTVWPRQSNKRDRTVSCCSSCAHLQTVPLLRVIRIW